MGSVYGTLRTPVPVLFTIFSGAQCFFIGATFWTVRTGLLKRDGVSNWWYTTRGLPLIPRNDLNPSPSDRVWASTIAGSCTGFILGFAFQGPRIAIPGTIMFTLCGWGGQRIYNYLDARNTKQLWERAQLDPEEQNKPRAPIMQRFLQSKWSPVTPLSDEQYENILREKILQVEAEIALVDDRIEEFRKKALEQAAEKLKEPPNPKPIEEKK